MSYAARPSTSNARPSISAPNPAISSTSAVKARHLSHLHSQLAQLSANLADLESLLRMTAVQAESLRGLGGWSGGLFMAASKVLGEEKANNGTAAQATATGPQIGRTDPMSDEDTT